MKYINTSIHQYINTSGYIGGGVRANMEVAENG